MSRVTLTGRAGADLDLRYTPAGRAVGAVNLAETHRRKVGDEWQDDGTSWYRVTIWGAKAEAAADTVTKGALLVVTGDLRIRDYEARDGSKGRAVEIVADEVGVVPAPARRARTPQAVEADPWAHQDQGGQ